MLSGLGITATLTGAVKSFITQDAWTQDASQSRRGTLLRRLLGTSRLNHPSLSRIRRVDPEGSESDNKEEQSQALRSHYASFGLFVRDDDAIVSSLMFFTIAGICLIQPVKLIGWPGQQ